MALARAKAIESIDDAFAADNLFILYGPQDGRPFNWHITTYTHHYHSRGTGGLHNIVHKIT